MLKADPDRDPLVRQILKWARAQTVPPLAPEAAPGTTERERELLAALGGLACIVSSGADKIGSAIPVEVSEWWDVSPCPPADIADKARRALHSGCDLFGELYTAIVSMSSRRRLGTVFTPPPVTDYMLTRCEEYGVKPATVVDPGAGVGAFTLEAATRWNVPVVAVDLNVATLGLLAARCHLAGHKTTDLPTQNGAAQGEPRRIHLVLRDFLAWLPKGLSRTTGPTLVIGNPPYTRHQGMDPRLKAAAREAAGPLISSGLAGMAAYFLAATLRYLRSSDALCMIVPGSWMHARYGREIREYLWHLTHRSVRLDVFRHDVDVFPRAQVAPVVLFVGPEAQEPRCLTVAEASISGRNVTTAQEEHVDRQLDQPQTYPRSPQDWISSSKRAAEIGESFAVHRGIATGRNAFFLLADEEVAEHRLPASVLTPVVSSLRGLKSETLDEETFEHLGSQGMKRWLLLAKPSDVEIPEVCAYLDHGARRGVGDGVLASLRAHWFALEDLLPAPLLLLPMTRHTFRVVRNTKGAKHTNSLYGLYPHSDDVDIDEAARWLRSESGQEALRRVARRYGGGMLKLEPRAVSFTPVPQSFGRA